MGKFFLIYLLFGILSNPMTAFIIVVILFILIDRRYMRWFPPPRALQNKAQAEAAFNSAIQYYRTAPKYLKKDSRRWAILARLAKLRNSMKTGSE